MTKIFTSEISDGNMSYKPGARDVVDRNHERFFASRGINPHKVVYMQQVHGSRIGVVKRPQLRAKTDGLITKTPGLWLAVYHADCIPLFYIDETIPAIGVAHVGWRAATNGLVGKMVAEMHKHFKSDPANIHVKCGPFICKQHYDVAIDDERTKILPTVPLEGGRFGLDLEAAVVTQLKEAGIAPANIDLAHECTAEHPKKYWSYHQVKDKVGGVMVSVIGMLD